MKKLFTMLLLLGNMIILSASNNNDGFNQMNWLNDLETLVQLDTQREDTLAGKDINANGIRDDVEAYVENKFKNDTFQKEMFLKAAQKIQKIITLPKDASVARHLKLDKELLSLYTCRDYILYREHEEKIEKEMLNKTLFKGKVLNTKERLSAYIEHKKKLPLNFSDLSKTQLQREKKSCLAMYNSFENIDKQASISLIQ